MSCQGSTCNQGRQGCKEHCTGHLVQENSDGSANGFATTDLQQPDVYDTIDAICLRILLAAVFTTLGAIVSFVAILLGVQA